MLDKKILYPFIALIAVIIIFNTIWKIYPFYGYKVLEDWYYIYSYQNCLDNNLFIPKYYTCNDLVTDKVFVYPKIWINISRFLKLNFINLIFIFIISYFFILYYFLRKILWFYFLFVFSPTSLLIIERGNNDLVILLLVFIFGITVASNKLQKLSFIPLIVSIKLKIFPIFLCSIYFWKKIFIKNYIQLVIIFISIFIFIDEILFINKIYNKSNVTLAYSAETIFNILNYLIKFNLQNNKIISVVCMLILVGISFLIKIKIKKNQKSNNIIFFLIGSLILISSFFLSNTYDYKFVFIVFCIPLFLELKKIKKNLLILILMCAWIEFIIFYARSYSNINSIYNNTILNLNFSSYVFIISTIAKNIIYWIINFYLIIITKNILFQKKLIKSNTLK